MYASPDEEAAFYAAHPELDPGPIAPEDAAFLADWYRETEETPRLHVVSDDEAAVAADDAFEAMSEAQHRHAKQVAFELDRMRAREEAKAILAAEKQAPTDGDESIVVDWGPVIERVQDPEWEPMAPTIGYDGTQLFYGPTDDGQGLINWVYGDSHSGKTRLVVACLAGEVLKGHHVGMLVFEDSGSEDLLKTLQVMGLTVDQVRSHVHVLRPTSGQTQWMGILAAQTDRHNIGVWGLDAFTSSAGYEQVDSNNQDQISQWIASVCQGISRLGASVIVIDHIAKDASNPWAPLGSVQKKNGVTGAMVRVHHTDGLQGWTRAMSGGVMVSSVKDRGGWHAQKEALAIFSFTPDAGGIYTLNEAAEARGAHALAKAKPWDALASWLEENPDATPAEMAVAMDRNKSTISRWLQKLGRPS